MRDKSVDIMSAIGILFVVMGHNYQPPLFFLPAYMFHMPLFFFISGYLFKVHAAPADKLEFIKRKLTYQLLPYYVFNLSFFAITEVLKRYGLFVHNDYSLDNLLLEPFFTGHQTPLIAPMWFLLQLFVLNIVFQAMYWSSKRTFAWILSLPILLAGLYLARKGLTHPLRIELLIVRTGIAAIFFQAGILVSTYKKDISRILKNPGLILVAWIVVSLIPTYFGNTTYSILWGSVDNERVYAPIISSLIIVLMIYGASQILAPAINDGSLILQLGRSSFWIMCLHLSGFFLVNLGFYESGLIEKGKLEQVYSAYHPEQTFLLYLAAGIFIPILVSQLFHCLREKIQGCLRLEPRMTHPPAGNATVR